MKYLAPAALAALGAALAGCSSPPAKVATAPAPTVLVAPAPAPAPAPEPLVVERPTGHYKVSAAETPRAYRADAAAHIYAANAERIYKGKMPPLLYAVGVLQVEVDGRGHVQRLNWMRAPSHAPEVVAEIERTVRAAAPYPVPARMGRVTYTDTWLWHKSGRFQLDTLTEGQL